MFRAFIAAPWFHGRNGKSNAAKPIRSPGKRFRPALEALESRDLPSFAAPVSYNIGTQATAFNGSVGGDGVAVGDFNGDGKPDLAVVHGADGTVNILMNNGDGTFRTAVPYATGSVNPVWASVGDFNGDGKLDLAVEGSQSATSLNGVLSIFLGNGDGTFRPAATYAAGSVARGGLAVGDFNGDGRPDLAIAQFGAINSTQSAVDIFINNGDGTFRPYYTVAVPAAARSVAVGDFNGDGKTDLAVADGIGTNNQVGTAGVTILLGNGDGTFQTAGQYLSPPTAGDGTVNPEFVTAGDLNNDGKTDLVVSDYDHNIDVFLGNGDGTFRPAVGYTTGEYPRAVAIADVNGDGRKDLVVDNIGAAEQSPPETGSVAVLLGNGDGTFQAPVQYTPFGYPGWLAVGDFNGDGRPDVAVTRVQDGHSVNVMLNQSDLAPPTHQVFAVGSDQSLWEFDPSGPQVLSPAGTILAISAAGAGDVFAVAADHSFWQYLGGGWRSLSPAGTILTASAGTDAAGHAQVVALASDQSLWEYASGWRQLSPAGIIASFSAGAAGEVFAVARDGSLWAYQASAWSEISATGTILNVAFGEDASGAAEVYAITANHALWVYRSGGWGLLSNGSFLSLGADHAGDVFAVLSDSSLWEYSSLGWRELSPAGAVRSVSAPP